MKVGKAPVNLGYVDLNPTEMMFWQYCPIKRINVDTDHVPCNLEQFNPLLDLVLEDIGISKWNASYIYMTVKTLWVSGDYIGNRPGWHTDGFGTEDLNYIWYDRAPTEFILGEFEVSDDCDGSIVDMTRIGMSTGRTFYPNKHLLKLDQRVVHRCPTDFEPGMRSFVKISVSKDEYNLEGNSINPHFGEIFSKKPRNLERNHPSSK